MYGILSFFSDLILFTAGLMVMLFWVVIFIAIAIEIIDLFKDEPIDAKDGDSDVRGPIR